MFTLLLIFHVFICLLLIFFVLMQSGKGAELGAAFGGVGQAQTTRSPMTGIGKATTVLAVLFMASSLTLAYMSSERANESVLKELQTLPDVPGAQIPVPGAQLNVPLPAGDDALPVVPIEEEEVPEVELEQTAAPALPAVPMAPSPVDEPPAATVPSPADIDASSAPMDDAEASSVSPASPEGTVTPMPPVAPQQ